MCSDGGARCALHGSEADMRLVTEQMANAHELAGSQDPDAKAFVSSATGALLRLLIMTFAARQKMSQPLGATIIAAIKHQHSPRQVKGINRTQTLIARP